MPSEDTEEARRQRSDDARRAALRERIERQKERERQIAADIANVDKKPTKRIVFEDSDDEEEEPTDKSDKKTTSKSSSSSSKRPKLFDSEDEKDEDDGNDLINEKTLVNRHTGAKGEKLMKLESRFNADPRFKLDDKFAESDSDEGGDAVLNAEKSEMKQEKDKNRELLSKILGKSVEEKKPKQTTSDASGALLKARPFTRFDPENPEHLEWMKAFEAAKNPKAQVKTAEKEEETREKEEDDNDKKADNEETEDDDKSDEEFEKTEMFFKMDDQFAEEMKERKEAGPPSTGGFSFLSMMGRKYEEQDADESDEQAETEEEAEAPKPIKTAEKPGKSSTQLLKTKPPASGAFFVDPFKDEKIQSMAANFRRTQTVEKIIDKWAPHRDAIFKLWKKQRRDAVKKQKDAFFTNGRQRKRKIEENGDAKEEEK